MTQPSEARQTEEWVHQHGMQAAQGMECTHDTCTYTRTHACTHTEVRAPPPPFINTRTPPPSSTSSSPYTHLHHPPISGEYQQRRSNPQH